MSNIIHWSHNLNFNGIEITKNLVFLNATGLFNLSGLNRGLKLWKGPCVGVSCCTLISHDKQVLIKGDAGFAVNFHLEENWFCWSRSSLSPQWLPCVEPQFAVVNKSFHLRAVLNGPAIQPLFSQVWRLVWPFCGLQRQVEVKAGLSYLQRRDKNW